MLTPVTITSRQRQATNVLKKPKRVESIDLLRGVVMIIMALDHVRDYFHRDAFLYDPTDLTQTSVPLFFTRFITHYCAPIFVFLAGISAFLYGVKKSRKELSFFLLTRGIWLVFAELFFVSLFRTFNLEFNYFNLQVIWVIGVSMIVLSGVIHLNRYVMLAIGLLLVFGHNLLDTVHVPGNSLSAFFWSFLHEKKYFTYGNVLIHMHYALLPWLGIMILGFFLGSIYAPGYNPAERKKIFFILGIGSIALFIILRSGNWYGDSALWSAQKDPEFSFLSFINVSKYPPSLLYTLITLGPAMLFLSFAEKPLNRVTEKIAVFGRVPMFYYMAHILLIHILSVIAGVATGYPQIIAFKGGVNTIQELKGYGFDLLTTYGVWIGVVLLLYPLCRWFDKYKRAHQARSWWLSYV